MTSYISSSSMTSSLMPTISPCINGAQQCGNNGTFYICDWGNWIEKHCGDTLECQTYVTDDSIICIYPHNHSSLMTSSSISPSPTNTPSCLHGAQKCLETGEFAVCVWGKFFKIHFLYC
jgi:hypothetical protein